MKVKVTEIQAHPSYRIDPGNMEEMKESIQEKGLIQPIVVRELPEGSPCKYELIAGYRRFKAMVSLRSTEIAIYILHPTNPLEQLDISLSENLQRKDFNPMEIFELILQRKQAWEKVHGPIKGGRPLNKEKLLTKVNSFYQQTAKLFKKNITDIHRFLQLGELDENLKEKVESGELYYRDALKEQSLRRESNSGKKGKPRGINLPEPPMDILGLKSQIRDVIIHISLLYQAMELIQGKEYDLSSLEDIRLHELIHMTGELIPWITQFNTQLNNTVLEKLGMETDIKC